MRAPWRAALAGAALVAGSFLFATGAAAQCAGTSCVVTSSADTSNGNGNPTLRDAITFANANPGTTITFSSAVAGQTVTLTGELPLILGNNTTIDGGANNITVSGVGTFRVFFIGGAGQTGEPASTIATIQHLTITAANAQGGVGGGGGGAGMGGAIFVSSTGTLNLANVALSSNKAVGGNGRPFPGGGGGGMGGGGGVNVFSGGGGSGGGGGGFGNSAAGGGQLGPGSAGRFTGGASGGNGSSGNGGSNGGGGGGSAILAGDGGGGGVGGGNDGSGGFGGGGGGASSVGNVTGGRGGFGGGGGGSFVLAGQGAGTGGAGGFGGGGGGGYRAGNGGRGGFGGGNGGNGSRPPGFDGFVTSFGGGGGGAGLGGAVFVQAGGSLTVTGSLSINNNTVVAGTGDGFPSGINGSAFGSGIFFQGVDGIVTNLGFGAGTQSIGDVIADYTGSGGANPGGGTNAADQGGSLSLAKTGSGTLLLSGANTYSGGTVISSGTVQVTNNASVGSGMVTLDGGVFQSGAAALTFANAFAINTGGGTIDTQADALTLSGPVADGNGAGALTKIGAGTLILTGTNTYTGGTTISSGALVIGDGATAGSILGNVANNGILAFNRSDTVTFGGLISGAGSLSQLGPGTLILTGANTYTGATNVNAGMLGVNGSIAGSSLTTVNNATVLFGTGTVGNLQINSGGVFAPGAMGVPGTSMTVQGNLAFQSAAFYLVQINPAGSTFANVAGTASLAGSVDAVFQSGTFVAHQYEILHAGAINGAFSGLQSVNLPPGFVAILSYTGTDALLNIRAALSPAGLNGNQQSVASALNDFFNGGGTLPPGFLNVFQLTGPGLANGLTQLDGEAATGAERGAFQLMTEFLGLMLDPFVEGRSSFGGPAGGAIGFAPAGEPGFPPDVALAYAGVLKAPPARPERFDQRWTAWGSSYGGSASAGGDPAAGSTPVTAATFGFAGGVDYRYSPDTILGFALAGGGTSWSLAQNLGSGRSDAFQGGVYGASHFGPAYMAAALAFTEHWMVVNRTAFAGDQLRATFNAQSVGARFEAGYRHAATPSIGVTPYAALQAQSFHTPSYSETDLTGGGFALSYRAMTAHDTRSELGARFDDLTAFGAMPLLLRARLAWAHDWVSNPALAAVFQALPGAGFIVNGAPLPKNSALATLGAELRITSKLALLAKFDGEFAPGAQTYAGSGTLRYAW